MKLYLIEFDQSVVGLLGTFKLTNIHNINKDFKEDFKNHKVVIKVLDSYGLG
jgi:hypothetical protein